MIGGVRRMLAGLVLASVLCVAGCGGSGHAPPASGASARVVDASCQSSAGVSQACTFVLGDGERFGCGRTFSGPAPTAGQLERAGCRRLASLKLSEAELAAIARLEVAQTCLTGKGLHAIGGPVLPTNPPDGAVQPSSPSGTAQPGGELVISSSHPTFVAFYADAAVAARVEPALSRADSSSHVQVERHGAETIVWSHPPTSQTRNMVRSCLPR
jgi:hypothetical protein